MPFRSGIKAFFRCISQPGIQHIARNARNTVAVAAGVAAGITAVARIQQRIGHFQSPVVVNLLIERQFEATPTGFSGIFVSGASAAAAVDNNFILSIGLENGSAEQAIAQTFFAA